MAFIIVSTYDLVNFSTKKSLCQPWFLMWHFDSSLQHVPFKNWGCGLFLFPHMFILSSSDVSCLCLCIPIIGLSLFIIIALCFSLRIVLISKPKHTSNEILMHLHCHSTPTLHDNYTLCLTMALLSKNSQLWFYVFVFIPLSQVANDKCFNFYLVCLSNSSSLAYSMSLRLWS